MTVRWKGSWGIIFANKNGTAEWELKLCHYKFLTAYADYQYEWHNITDEQYQAILSGEKTAETVWNEITKTL